MNLQPEELETKGYVLLDKLEHNELVPFIRTYIKKKNKYSIFYNVSNVVLFILAGVYFVYDYNTTSFSFADKFAHFAYGLALAFALVPIHEYIHVLAYKSQGAKNTSYDVNLKKFFFMALADKFVANKREFEVVALAPFVCISTVLVVLFFVVSSTWTLTIIGILLAHTAMCSGDFGLLSYFEFHKSKGVVTFDDIKNKVSYFYGLRE